jgi:hypothetical protein
MVRSFALGKIYRSIKNYTDDGKVEKLDRRLIKGFYVSNAIELENESEEEAVKFSMNIDAGKVDKVLLQRDQSKDAAA